jgi:hypothetical protein
MELSSIDPQRLGRPAVIAGCKRFGRIELNLAVRNSPVR